MAVTGETPEALAAGLEAFVGAAGDESRAGESRAGRGSHANGASAGARGRFHTGEARPGNRPRLAFLFPGQGAQYAGMALGLYEREPVFRDALDACAEILDELLDRRLLSLLQAPASTDSPLDETRYTQPALFAVEYALAELWSSWGVPPSSPAATAWGSTWPPAWPGCSASRTPSD